MGLFCADDMPCADRFPLFLDLIHLAVGVADGRITACLDGAQRQWPFQMCVLGFDLFFKGQLLPGCSCLRVGDRFHPQPAPGRQFLFRLFQALGHTGGFLFGFCELRPIHIRRPLVLREGQFGMLWLILFRSMLRFFCLG